MPTLNDAIASAKSFEQPTPAAPMPAAPAPSSSMQPARNAMIRCPLPPLWQGESDSLRQFYVGGKVPQTRIMTPRPIPNSGAGGVVNQYAAIIGGGGGTGGGTTTQIIQSTLFATQVVLTTPVLLSGQSYQLSKPMSQSFQLLGVASAIALRFQMYGSAIAQTSDAARGLDVPPAAGTVQGIISDVALDTLPFIWNFENRVGANCEIPQSSLIYFTLTNLSAGPAAIVATLQYVPLATATNPGSPQVTLAGVPLSTLDLGSSSGIVMSTGANFSGPINAPIMNVVTSGVGLQIQGNQISSVNLADSENIAVLDSSPVFTGTVSAPVLNAISADGLQIGGAQISSANLSDSENLALLNSSPVFSGTISAPILNASSASGLQINGSQIASADLSDSENIAYLNVSNTFTSPINAPVISVNSAAGLQVNGAQVSTSTLANGSDIAMLNVSNTFTGPINAPVVDVATSAGLTVGGTQLSSINLLDSGNLATLNGVNVFTNAVSAPTINATGSAANVFTGPVHGATFNATGSSASVFTGPVESAQFTQASGSTSACTFNGVVNAATFNGNVTTVDLTCTGGTVNFTGSGLTVTEINTFAPPSESNADKTLNHVLIQAAAVGSTYGFTASEISSTGLSFSVTAASTSDVFDLDAQMLYSIINGAHPVNGAFLVALVDGVIGSQFGFGIDNVFSGLGPSVCTYRGNTTGLSVGAHTITVYYSAMVLSGTTPGPSNPSGSLTFINTTGSCQQISA